MMKQEFTAHVLAAEPRGATLLLVALTATGFATGTLQSIFTGIGGRWSEPPSASDYAHLDAAAIQDVFEQILNFDSGARAALRLEQSYYNGEQLALGWSLQPEGNFAWFYDTGDARYADVRPTQEQQQDGDVIVTDVDLYKQIGAERADNSTAASKRTTGQAWRGTNATSGITSSFLT